MKDLQKLQLNCAIDRAIQKIFGAKKPQKPISCGVLRKFPCGVFAGSDPASLDPAKDLAKYSELLDINIGLSCRIYAEYTVGGGGVGRIG